MKPQPRERPASKNQIDWAGARSGFVLPDIFYRRTGTLVRKKYNRLSAGRLDGNVVGNRGHADTGECAAAHGGISVDGRFYCQRSFSTLW